MPTQLPEPQDTAGILIVVFIVTAAALRYWRITISLILAAAVALTITGLIEGLAAFYHLIR